MPISIQTVNIPGVLQTLSCTAYPFSAREERPAVIQEAEAFERRKSLTLALDAGETKNHDIIITREQSGTGAKRHSPSYWALRQTADGFIAAIEDKIRSGYVVQEIWIEALAHPSSIAGNVQAQWVKTGWLNRYGHKDYVSKIKMAEPRATQNCDRAEWTVGFKAVFSAPAEKGGAVMVS